MRQPHSPCQVPPPLHQSPPAMWLVVRPGTQSLRGHLRRVGTMAGSPVRRTRHHTCTRQETDFYPVVHLNFIQHTFTIQAEGLACNVRGRTTHVHGTCWDTAGQCRCHPGPTRLALHSNSGSI